MRLQLNTDNIYPKKSLGQNFIHNNDFLLRLSRYIHSSSNTIIIEIGPGKGALTEHLSQKSFKEIYLIEKDTMLADILKSKFEFNNKIIVINDDALLYNFDYFNNKKNVIICGNLPFNISTRLLTRWLNNDPWPSFFNKMILMFQKEVADRIIADHNTKKYGRLSVLVQSRCKVSKLLDAPAPIFYPRPKVDGSVILFEPIKDYEKISFSKLGKLLEKSFSSRRKTIKNNLREYSQILASLDIDANLRPENLSVSDYCNLTKYIH